MKRRIVASGLVSVGAMLLLGAPVLAYQSPQPGGGSGGTGAATGGTSAASGLPNTSASQPDPGISPVAVAGLVAGGGLVLAGGFGLAYRRRR
jgi:hypothetical protein